MKYFKYDTYEDEYTKHIPKWGELVIYYSNNIVEVDINDTELDNFLLNQKEEINIIEITEAEFKAIFKNSLQAKRLKEMTREKIRDIKDFEDDFIDQKIVTQNILYLLSDIWLNVFTEEQKINSKYKDLMDSLTLSLSDPTLILRADLENAERLSSILNDEKNFAGIVNKDYLSKIK